LEAENNDQLIIREAEEKDIPKILVLIKELAEYEKLTQYVTADEAILKENLFGSKRYAYVVLAEYEGNLAGQAIFFYNFSTFQGKPGIYLEDLYVSPGYRNKGIGKALLKYLIELAKAKNCGRVQWIVLDWNKPAIKFYESLGAEPMKDWIVFMLSEENYPKL
jgi:GNAT superfamily N-acetyltransferase